MGGGRVCTLYRLGYTNGDCPGGWVRRKARVIYEVINARSLFFLLDGLTFKMRLVKYHFFIMVIFNNYWAFVSHEL